MNNRELAMLQALPLVIKIQKSKQRIREAIKYFGVDHLYVPVSGGKDSMVVSHLVETIQKELGIPKEKIPRVNSNTGNEYDDVLANARRLSDIEVKPKHNLIWVLTNVGYPIGSKKISRMLRDLQNPTPENYNSRRLYIDGIKRDGTKTKSFKMPKKWYPFIDSCIRCSEKCCYYLKKEPMNIYEKETDRRPILGTMASEGGTRKGGYLQTGCNAFNTGKGKSMPIGFWEETDILHYIVAFGLTVFLPKVYGEIKEYIETENGIEILKSYNKEKALYDLNNFNRVNLKTTGEKRTGCVWCTLGVQMEKGKNRFQKLYENDKRKYNFAINGGKLDEHGKLIPGNGGLGMGKILDLMGINYKPIEEKEYEIKFGEQISIFNQSYRKESEREWNL